jgi:hypothetical protein
VQDLGFFARALRGGEWSESGEQQGSEEGTASRHGGVLEALRIIGSGFMRMQYGEKWKNRPEQRISIMKFGNLCILAAQLICRFELSYILAPC